MKTLAGCSGDARCRFDAGAPQQRQLTFGRQPSLTAQHQDVGFLLGHLALAHGTVRDAVIAPQQRQIAIAIGPVLSQHSESGCTGDHLYRNLFADSADSATRVSEYRLQAGRCIELEQKDLLFVDMR